MRKAANVIFNIFFLLLGAGIIGGAVWYSAFVDQLTLEKTVVIGNHFLDSGSVEKVVSRYRGESLRSMDISELQRSLKKIDYLKDVVVSRRFPSTLIVEIVENTPLAIIRCSDGQVAIDSDGAILPVTDNVISYFALPIVSGITDQYAVSELKSGSRKEPLRDVLQIVKCLYSDCDSLAGWVTAINITREYVLLKNNMRRPTAITFTRNNFYNNTAILNAFANTLSPNLKLEDFEYINLTIPNQIIVKEKRT
ncbi:MAG: FtsQ-type POTRA domain-containing protein [FCB group bacterium]|nr:FtsQ-type POTRA domain-containing protein [FCB group bacterium]